MKSKPIRQYRMTARAEAAEQTGERILDAMLRRYAETPYDQIRLEDVAADAGVTPQTVFRRFGSKPGVLIATVEREQASLVRDRAAAMGESPRDTVRSLVRFYERHGTLILKLYAEAHQAPGVPELAARGREYHVGWCRQAFADALETGLDEATRARRLAQVVAVCDAATWRVLRVDGGLSAEETEQAVLELLLPLLSEAVRG